jgi:hypothetical protein
LQPNAFAFPYAVGPTKGDEMPAIKLGQPFPHAIQSGGMTTFMKNADRANEGIDIVLVISLRKFHPVEVVALVEEPIRLGIVRFESIIFFLLEAEHSIVFDSPFGIGLYTPEIAGELLQALRDARGWPAMARRRIDLVAVDADTNLVESVRKTTLTRTWWVALADELERCPLALSRQEYDAATQRAYLQWKTPAEMIDHCVIIEEVGI